MSPDLERLIGRAATSKPFRDELLADVDQAVKNSGLSLSTDELNELKASIEKLKNSPSAQQLDQQLTVLGWK